MKAEKDRSGAVQDAAIYSSGTELAEHCLHGRDGKPRVYVGTTCNGKTCDFCWLTGKLRRVPIKKCRHYEDKEPVIREPLGITDIPKRRRNNG